MNKNTLANNIDKQNITNKGCELADKMYSVLKAKGKETLENNCKFILNIF